MRQAIRDTLHLLRLPFSFLLLPIYLLALSQAAVVNENQALWVAVILHLLVYPASNGYNSWVDRDTTPIGGLKAPPPPPKLLLYTTLVLDLLALAAALWIQPWFALGVGVYILASRAYSWEVTRLKQYPIGGFLTIFVFQGLLTYATVLLGIVPPAHWQELLSPHQAALAVAAASLIGGVYPLTQIYQHQEDAERGDRTLSQVLGYRGSFIFAGSFFALAGVILALNLKLQDFLLFSSFLLPVLAYFIYWAQKVWKNTQAASFEHTMRLNLLASACLNLCFGLMCLWRNG
ncbi:prenyltransferase [bacterium (Candidatus Blackallbacteria) CG17_big_fil_post_rev_8_21_14_2_50_48_46]|uniref:Prenyltransferase n=1 Tax=bacterium (Candidatus Blackallbacteria) CG17_big_fil_post_rev_8_21_14_2_50_48_46 TaxID=2014261 RepID=A0A2M7G763_9BACT|nr:MAG: prenyltransferase [bacterium (Candidatus Blackallbacteria) CG18_big_fil_WC_8_21_14_2_50_49_26]PIW17885.1 MAG: prenyltransferase [bacterium (Candidatus Blackallbacteria) CG17_big_fil_post_rev_8_21_14_2_50_48_46]PIW48561.1 MAG: prenyltransferase [bacterium (Candidatus Blackallbacteria) CG13_big_fil_rev_8_21_14_2_50_49_14]